MREIVPLNNNGSIQLKFTVEGQRYSFNPIKGGKYGIKRDMAIAQSIVVKIQNDILAGVFDPTLNRYRPNPTQEHEKLNHNFPNKLRSKNSQLLLVWDAWVESLELPPATKANHYQCVRRMLLKAKPTISDVEWLTNAKLSPSTFNKRLSYVKSCFEWGMANCIVQNNPFSSIKSRKATKPQIKPFTQKELRIIIAGFESRYPHYAPFVTFMGMTGTRFSEARGLLYKHINFERNELTICESLSRDRTGNGYQTVRKSTKTGSIRYLTMTQELRNILIKLPQGKPDELVFKSSMGCPISADNFREDWKRVLEDVGVEYRKPHTLRHSLLSHAIEQGIPLTGVAYLAGHADTRMVMQTYGHMINRPSLPEIKV